MYKFFPVFLFLLVGCDPGPAIQCDYCHTMREGAKRYTCDKCKMPHVACDVERAVMHYEEMRTLRGAISYSATSLLVCPSPEDPATPRVAAKPEPLKNIPLWLQIVSGIVILVAFFGGYGKGRNDGANSSFCRNKDCLKERGLK